MARSLFYRRRFLNRRGHHANAYVAAEVELEQNQKKDGLLVNAGFTVADCNRSATLDFDIYHDRDVANALRKARLLQEILDGFVAALEHAVDERANSECDAQLPGS
ncbi:hypothetical protein CGZ94_04285 [Enemella evansiae]|uniref:Uncharacterized protein n=1 Tax=Enemella evansiae TaxID=2016499 RepID=A0A255GKQ4_9ACTN|nr:hypothetical protein [Enemella evansiae]OYO16407.1 hypothetical protein CGZ94_04285 [Enemella evansiae]